MRFAEFLKDQRIAKPANFIHQPEVSVIMPTYCRAHDGLLARSIRSVLSQTFSDFEFIILDDGSVDGSQDIILDFQKQDNRVLYVRHETNSGLWALRDDEGILLSRGDYVAFQGDDDEWFPPFLRRVVEEARRKNSSFVHCQAEYRVVDRIAYPAFPDKQPTYAGLLENNKIANNSVLVHKRLFNKVGLYNPHVILSRFGDWDLWLRCARFELPHLLPEVLVRVNAALPDSVSLQHRPLNHEYWMFMMGLFKDAEPRPQNILDYELMSLKNYARNAPPDRIARLYRDLVLPWIGKRKENFDHSAISMEGLSDIQSFFRKYGFLLKIRAFVLGIKDYFNHTVCAGFKSLRIRSRDYIKIHGRLRFIGAALKYPFTMVSRRQSAHRGPIAAIK